MKPQYDIVSISDVHYGNPGLPPQLLYQRLQQVLYPLLTSGKTKLLCIAGDWYDTLLTFNSAAGFYAGQSIREIDELSRQHGFYIRALRGTHLHDRDAQMQWFSSLQQPLLDGAPRVRVVTEVDLEELTPLELKILYIPDDLPFTNVTTVVEEKLQQRNWTQVDLAITHSYYRHLLGQVPVEPPNTLSYEFMRKVCRGQVVNGHVHTANVFQHIVTNGSFDRFAHGETETKGCFCIHRDGQKYRVDFQPNHTATPYWTIDVTEATEPVTAFVQQFERYLTDHPSPTPLAIRIIHPDNHLVHEMGQRAKALYPHVRLSRKKIERLTGSPTPVILPVLSTLTPQNEPEKLAEFLVERKAKVKLPSARIAEILATARSST
jgi:hypothetical protein